jgi:large subunit ribosomal protein L30e
MAVEKVIKKKRGVDSINAHLALVMKSGKAFLGYRACLRAIRANKAKMVILASNLPPLRKSEIEYYAMLSKITVHHYTGNNVAMGSAVQKMYRCSIVTIIDAGDSDILRVEA